MALTEINAKGIKDGEIVNADINASAAIAGSKLAASTTSVAGSMSAADKTKLDGVAASANNYIHPNHSGDVTSSADGATTIADNAVTLAKMAGGTDGQIITYDASGDPVAVGPGTDGQVLTSTGAGSPPAFEDAASSGAALTGSTNNTITTVTGANAIQGEANLTFDGSALQVNSQLGIGAAPAAWQQFHITAADPRIRIESSGTNSAKIQFADSGSGDVGVIEYSHSDNSMRFNTNSVERIRVHAGGETNFTAGIVLGNGSTYAAANTLDDYEEGTFTAAYYYADGTHMGDADGRYTKIGNTVRVSVFEHAGAAAGTTSKDMSWIQGFPFNCRSEPNSVGTIVRYGGGNHQQIDAGGTCYIAQGGTRIKFGSTFNTGSGNWTTSLVYETDA